jgi:hypothetical protein
VDEVIGRIFGKFTVISQQPSKHWKRQWLCRCICGEERTISTEHLTSGKRTGCNSCNNGNKSRPFEALFNALVHMAKGRTTVDLKYDEYITFTKTNKCHYCRSYIEWIPHYSNPHGHHLDRKDNNLGYTKENCVVCCARCNRAKSNHFTYEEWLQIGKLIRGWK